jgi:hypothetical protein
MLHLAGSFILVEELHSPSLPRKNCSVNSRPQDPAQLFFWKELDGRWIPDNLTLLSAHFVEIDTVIWQESLPH